MYDETRDTESVELPDNTLMEEVIENKSRINTKQDI